MGNKELDFDYKVGDTVYCIDDRHTHPNAAFHFKQWPQKDRKYTVRGFADNNGIVTGVYMEELHNPSEYIRLLGREQEYAFATWRFKKADEVAGHAEDELLNSLMKEENAEVETYI